MFGDLNRAEIIGNITNDIQVRYTGSGTAVGVATNRSYKNPASDEWQDETTFHNVVVWAKQAEMLAERARKGTRVFISGRMQTRSWDDQDGKKNYKTEIVASEIILLDRYEKGPSGDSGSASGSIADTKVAEEGGSSKSKSNKSDKVIDPDDLPF
ncbi:single-stranded DNA-binding protein [Candidatus Dojkabacteria bacterium]|uniref:Single-stranded DNA-binding protein n=1 Tax=Candidatus Dojkabacteria bacterium TaxID=2099670 RepID=A0A955L5N6_9BACT|nr:single-stranded DNA-binding protein [Candidatus Dojkabacteria bacterium]